MASGSAQGSSTGTRRWTLDGRSDEDRLADHSRGCAPYDFEASGPPIAIGEKVEVVELSAPSERDVEKAEWMDVPESPLTNDEVKALAAAVIAYELEPNEVYMTRDDSLALWGEVSRRLQDERSAVLSAVPSRPGGDAERVAREVAEELRTASSNVWMSRRWNAWHAELADRLSPSASVAGPETGAGCETCEPYGGEGRVPAGFDGIDGRPMMDPCPSCSAPHGRDG